MDWEQTKENFAPVRQGRPKAVLSDVHDAADSATKASNQNKRRELERDIREYQGDDPLEPWLRLVKWTQEQLLGGSKTQLQETIEKCTKALNALGGKYNSDVRYLRLWIQYADCLSDPSDVFFFLRDKQIGHEYALLYEAHATHYELKGNCTAADAVYQEGIRRGAKPVERIKQKYVAFQTRMAQRIQRKIQEEGLRDAAGMRAGDGAPARTSFSSLRQVQPQGYSSSSTGRPGHPAAPPPQLLGVTSGPAQGAFAAATRLPLPGVRAGNPLFPASALPNVLSMQKPLQPLPVAVDAEFQGRRPPADVPLPGFLAFPQVSGMKELKPHAVLHKENNDQAGIWTSAALPQNKALMSSAHAGAGPGADSSRLEICVDEEFLDTAAPAPQHQHQQQQQDAVRAMLDRPFLPLGAPAQLPGQPHDRPAATAAAAASSVPGEAANTKLEQDKKACHLGCDVRLLADLHGGEQSFEEARALKWLSSQGSKLSAEAGTPGASGMAHCRGEQQQPALPAVPSAPLQPQAQSMSAAPGSTAVPGGQPRVPFNLGPAPAPDSRRPAAPAACVEPSSMRAAARKPLSDASGCMRGLSSAGMGRGGAGGEEHGCAAPRAGASDALVQHNQQLPASSCAAAGGGGFAAHESQLDPTVTMTTKAAFDILNDMFNDSLAHGAGHAAAADWQQPRACSPSAGAQGVDTAAACSGSSAGGLRGSYAGRDAWAPAPEPTVTISTRDAFNMLNDMFCDQLPHEQERLRQQPRPMQGTHGQGRAASKPISASDVCRLANMSKSAAGARCTAAPVSTTASSFAMHEDTEFGISGLLAGHHGTSFSSMVYEDTDMLGNSSHNNNVAYKPTHQLTSQGARHLQITSQPPGNIPMLLHEDTEFMTRSLVQLLPDSSFV